MNGGNFSNSIIAEDWVSIVRRSCGSCIQGRKGGDGIRSTILIMRLR